MRGEELKGYLAGLRHAAGLVRGAGQRAENQAWAMSRPIADRVRMAAAEIENVAAQMEAEASERRPIPGLDRDGRAI